MDVTSLTNYHHYNIYLNYNNPLRGLASQNGMLLSVIKYLKVKILSDEGPWDKILSTEIPRLICVNVGVLVVKGLGTTGLSNAVNETTVTFVFIVALL